MFCVVLLRAAKIKFQIHYFSFFLVEDFLSEIGCGLQKVSNKMSRVIEEFELGELSYYSILNVQKYVPGEIIQNAIHLCLKLGADKYICVPGIDALRSLQ